MSRSREVAAASFGRRNLIINGAMQVAQRGTSVSSVSSSGYRTVDRYRHTVSIATWTVSQSTDAPDGFGYSMKMDCTTAEASPASTSALALVQKIEGQDLQQLKKGTASAEQVTLSFWVKCTKTGTAQVNLIDEDNTRMISQQFTIDATNTWEQKTLTFVGDTTGALDNDNNSSLRVEIWLDAGSSYKSGSTPTSWEALSTTDYFAGCDLNLGDSTANDIYITGVQLEVGSTATAFEHRPYGVELALCQRYFEVQNLHLGSMEFRSNQYHNAFNYYVGNYFPFIKKRALPSVTVTPIGTLNTANTASRYKVLNSGGVPYYCWRFNPLQISTSGCSIIGAHWDGNTWSNHDFYGAEKVTGDPSTNSQLGLGYIDLLADAEL